MAIIRKKTGNFLEDFRIGQVLRHKVGKTVTEGLVNAFTEFSMTTNPLHKNRRECLEELRTGDGRSLPTHVKAEILREIERLELVLRQISDELFKQAAASSRECLRKEGYPKKQLAKLTDKECFFIQSEYTRRFLGMGPSQQAIDLGWL